MGKRSRKSGDAAEAVNNSNANGHSKKILLSDDKAVDPSLAALFASSAGPVKAPPKSRYEEPPPPRKRATPEIEETSEDGISDPGDEDEDEGLSSVDEDIDEANVMDMSDGEDEESIEESDEEPTLDKIIDAAAPKPDKKRKRKTDDGDLEGKYMQKLAREEEREEEERQAERRLKRQRTTAAKEVDDSDEEEDAEDNENASEESGSGGESEDEIADAGTSFPLDVPVHESLAPSKDTTELEKASRTVFLANVSTDAITSKSANKTLMKHMGSFLDPLPAPPEGKPAHGIESLRFRSTAYAGTSMGKKGAFITKDLMAATTKSTNAYVVYTTAYAAREAVKRLNGSMVLDRHLRVDGVAHPAKTDHLRCVFVGNLGFVDDESMLDQGGENERKRSKIPSDIEEGLWRQFSKAGTVESVRVVRDEKTRVGKGFAYVQFEDPNAVEAALLFNDKKYPPMLPRILRVVRAKAVRKTALASASRSAPRPGGGKDRVYNPKMPAEQSSLQGRAGKLLGRAGAAQFRNGRGSGANDMVLGKRGDGKASGIEGIAKTPEKIVFEGYRATAGNKPNLGGKKKKSSKPVNRGAKRANAWKKGGAKKAK